MTAPLSVVPQIMQRRDIVSRMRDLADAIERGVYPNTRMCALALSHGGKVTAFAWGDGNDLEAAGLFAKGADLSLRCVDIAEAEYPEAPS